MTDSSSTELPAAAAVIAAFGGIRPMAARLDVPVSTVQGWKQRDAIPDNRVEEIRAAAAADGIDLAGLPDIPEVLPDEADEHDTETPGDGDTAVPASEAPDAAPAATNATSAPPAAPARSGGGTAIAVVALVVAAGVAGWTWYSQQQTAGGGIADRVTAVERNIAGLDALRGDIAALRGEVGKLAARPEAADGAALAALRERLDALAGKVDALSAASGDDGKLAALAQQVGDINAAVSSNTAEIASLRTGIDTTMSDLSVRLTALENRAGSADAAEARAVGLAIAAAELRRNLLNGAAYQPTLATVRELASGDTALAPHLETLGKSATSGVPTVAALARRFDGLIGDILETARADHDAPWYRKAMDRVASVVSIRRIGSDAEGDTIDAVVARIEAELADGDLAGAVAEAEALSGDAAAVAASWLADARRTLAAEAAARAISDAALSTLARSRSGGQGG